ncbi:RNA-binding S4 domain-containing protein [Halocola ammonii]
MRVDKYLWAVRVFKTRSLATKECKQGRISIDDAAVKPSREVKEGEVVDVRKGPITHSYKVLDFPKSRVGAKLVEDFMQEVTSDEQKEKMEKIKLAQKGQRRRGMGRPTKKDRRDINKFLK